MVFAMILASGTGSRMGHTDCPKQFLVVNNKPIIVHTIEAFNQNKQIDEILIVTSKEYVLKVQEWAKQYHLDKVKNVVCGGLSRQESVYHGLEFLKDRGINEDDIVLIHDVVRPLVSQKIIDDNIDGVKKYGAVSTAIVASDTIFKSIEGKSINEILDRSELYLGQTPQSFFFHIILKAHELAKMNNDMTATDDCRLVLKYGHDVHLIEGSKHNFKITTQDDLKIYEALVK